MTRRHNWYPLKIYDILYKLGHENGELSYQEVGFMLMREACLPFGFDCDHPNDKIRESPTDKQPYCYNCMSRLEPFEEQVLEQIGDSKFGKYRTVTAFRAKQTFLDKIRIENKQKLDAEFEARVKAEVDNRIKALIEEALRKDRERSQL